MEPRPRDTVVVDALAVSENQLRPCVARQITGEVHMVLEIAAAELALVRIARTIRAATRCSSTAPAASPRASHRSLAGPSERRQGSVCHPAAGRGRRAPAE